jgi:site-specific recombinase XerD
MAATAAPAKRKRPEAPPPDCLTPDEVESLFGAVSGRSKTALRDRAMLMLQYDAALRPEEVVSLRPADVDVKRGDVRVIEGKGGKSRTIPDCLHTDTREALAAWIAKRDTLGWDNRSARLFGVFYTRPNLVSAGDRSAESKGGRKLDTSHLRRLLPRLARLAGIRKHMYPHLLRHSRARHWSDEGKPPADIQKWLGHSSLQTTSIYLDKMAPPGVGAGDRPRSSRG